MLPILAKSTLSAVAMVTPMSPGNRPKSLLMVLAALARIEERDGQAEPRRRTVMKTREQTWNDATDRELKAGMRAMWAQGDYHRFATELIWELGPVIVEAARVGPGQRVLDVAAGTGNVAIRAAEAGADVVASDLAPENFAAGRRHARECGVELEWREADAEALPFSDDEFDVVTSSFGAIFAPHHQRVADELVRVCRPGGTIAMTAFTPQGVGGAFFEVVGRYAPPPPPGAEPPIAWGNEGHVRALFGERVTLEITRREYLERAPTPQAYCAFFHETFGPVIAIRRSLANDPARAAAFDHDFLEFATRSNRGPAGGHAEYPYEYLLIVARKSA